MAPDSGTPQDETVPAGLSAIPEEFQPACGQQRQPVPLLAPVTMTSLPA